MVKKILLILLALLVVIQFIRPAKNNSGDFRNDISAVYPVPPQVQLILQRACYDCHSNNTVYPWYSRIQPVAWWLQDHINEGKRHLNYSGFALLPLKKQAHKMEETVEMMEKKEMPLESYTWLHKEARLSDEERRTMVEWARALQKRIEGDMNRVNTN